MCLVVPKITFGPFWPPLTAHPLSCLLPGWFSNVDPVALSPSHSVPVPCPVLFLSPLLLPGRVSYCRTPEPRLYSTGR